MAAGTAAVTWTELQKKDFVHVSNSVNSLENCSTSAPISVGQQLTPSSSNDEVFVALCWSYNERRSTKEKKKQNF